MNRRTVPADDHRVVLDGIRAALQKAGLDVMAEVPDGRDAVKVAREQNPDLVVMGVSIPGMNGIEATLLITRKRPGVKVPCLSMHANRKIVAAGLEGRASGYVLEECAFEELIEAIRIVMAGQTYLCSTVADKVERAHEAGISGASTWNGSELTTRQREVLQLIAEGHTNKDVAARLCVSVKTVSTHRQHIMDKLNIHNAVGLVKYAIRQGMTSLDDVAPASNGSPRPR